MNKKHIKNMLRLLFILAAMMIWAGSIYYSQFLKEHYTSVSVRLQGEGIPLSTLEKAIQNEAIKKSPIPELTCWNKKNKDDIICIATGYKTSVVIYELFGDCTQVYPVELVEGGYVASLDYYGCMVDENTAYILFGTKYAVGNSVSFKNKTYYIRGVMKTKQPMFFIQVSNTKQKYQNLELGSLDVEKGFDLVDAFFLQNQLSTNYTVLEGGFYANIVERMCLIPTWLLMAIIINKSFYLLYKYKTLHPKMLLYIAMNITFIGMLLWLTSFSFYLPTRMIPSKWSNLDFWVHQYKAFLIFIDEITYLTPLPKDVLLFQGLRKSILYTLLNCINLCILLAHQRILSAWISSFTEKLKRPKIFIAVGLVLFISLCSILLLHLLGLNFILPLYYPTILILYMLLLKV